MFFFLKDFRLGSVVDGVVKVKISCDAVSDAGFYCLLRSSYGVRTSPVSSRNLNFASSSALPSDLAQPRRSSVFLSRIYPNSQARFRVLPEGRKHSSCMMSDFGVLKWLLWCSGWYNLSFNEKVLLQRKWRCEGASCFRCMPYGKFIPENMT